MKAVLCIGLVAFAAVSVATVPPSASEDMQACEADGGCDDNALVMIQGKIQGLYGKRTGKIQGSELPLPFMLEALPDGKCQGDSFADKGGQTCNAPWVYCTDARCDSTLQDKNGVLIAKCLCWMPKKTLDTKLVSLNESIIPKETSGAACVYNQVKAGSYPFSAIGGDGMCEEMKKGALISTYGPLGHAPPARAVKCAPKTQWAWCWGAPCSKVNGQIICDCPIIISNYNTSQYVSVSKDVCAEEEGLEDEPCTLIHNGSPAGEAPMGNMAQCGE